MTWAVTPRTHIHIPGSDFYQCGMSGPHVKFTTDPAKSDCGNCKKTVRFKDGQWIVRARWTQYCTGCFETVDGHTDEDFEDENGKPLRGVGCEECGYKGVRYRDEWLPLNQ